MPVKHEEKLREIAEHARKVEKLINQGEPLDQFPPPRSNIPRRSPDDGLQKIERQLKAVAEAIETYLGQRTG
jgi:hypothetical protein